MTTKKKTWKEKLNNSHDLPKVVKLKGKMMKKWGKGILLVPAPIEVDAIMKKIPKGKIITVNNIREFLAKKHKATMTCPIVTGISTWIASYAAEEELQSGKTKITPYWRTLKASGLLNEKYPGRALKQKKLLEKEGHKIIQKGTKYIVADFEKKLVQLK